MRAIRASILGAVTSNAKSVKNINKDSERNEKCSQIFAHLGGGKDCVTASCAGVAGSGPTEKEQKCVPFSFIHDPSL